MKVTLTIPDEVYEKYQAMASRQRPVEKLMVDNITTFAETSDGHRWLLVSPDNRRELEKVLGAKGHILTGSGLVDRVRRRMAVSFGGVNVTLTDGQIETIRRRAERAGKSPSEFLQHISQDIAGQLLGYV